MRREKNKSGKGESLSSFLSRCSLCISTKAEAKDKKKKKKNNNECSPTHLGRESILDGLDKK